MKLNYFLVAGLTVATATVSAQGLPNLNPTTTNIGNGFAVSATIGFGFDKMNMLVNKTPVKPEACPTLDVDLYQDGFNVIRQKSYYYSAGAVLSKWVPTAKWPATTGIWSSVSVGPIKNHFGLYFTEIGQIEELSEAKKMRLPDTNEELAKWKVKDAAYWEDQGGVAFYLGAGYFPADIGLFAVATGGWANYLQKTGPNKVYVERSKKKINSVTLSANVPVASLFESKIKESSVGFSYEFTLDNEASIEAFERFMAGDITKAQELTEIPNSGVMKISDITDVRSISSRGMNFGLFLPFPFTFTSNLLSLKMSSDTSYEHFEENSVWDEKLVKDLGSYEKKKATRLMGKMLSTNRSFVGGQTVTDVPGADTRVVNEKLFGIFKYSYQSTWGQEDRLRKYVARVKSLTGLTEETCVNVPEIDKSLKFNQVVLQLGLSTEYIKEIIGKGNSNQGEFLDKIERLAQAYYSQDKNGDLCAVPAETENVEVNYDDTCTATTSKSITKVFAKLREYAGNMNAAYGDDKQEFTKNFIKFGKEVWSSPFIFKAVYEKGKTCGQEFTYEVSGQRITRHYLTKKFAYRPACIQ